MGRVLDFCTGPISLLAFHLLLAVYDSLESIAERRPGHFFLFNSYIGVPKHGHFFILTIRVHLTRYCNAWEYNCMRATKEATRRRVTQTSRLGKNDANSNTRNQL